MSAVSSFAVMVMEDNLRKGKATVFPSIGITLTRANLKERSEIVNQNIEDMRKPESDALWSLTLETRFGPDYLSLEPATLIGGETAVNLCANETTDPLDGWQRTDILMRRTDLEQLRVGIDHALAWLDEQDRLADIFTPGEHDHEGRHLGRRVALER